MNESEPELDEKYPVTVKWTGERTLADVLVDNQITIKVGRYELEKKERLFLPEELFVASGAICFMNSFIYFTKKMHITFLDFEVESVGTLAKVERSFEVTEIHSKAIVGIDSETSKKKAERALELGAKYCFVANSMKCPTYHTHEILVR